MLLSICVSVCLSVASTDLATRSDITRRSSCVSGYTVWPTSLLHSSACLNQCNMQQSIAIGWVHIVSTYRGDTLVQSSVSLLFSSFCVFIILLTILSMDFNARIAVLMSFGSWYVRKNRYHWIFA